MRHTGNGGAAIPMNAAFGSNNRVTRFVVKVVLAGFLCLSALLWRVAPAYAQQERRTVLYVTTNTQTAVAFQKAVAGTEIKVEVVAPQKVPATVEVLQRYDSIFLSNIPARMLSTTQMTALQTACHDFGVGVGIIGGDNSYAAGGYRGTPLETMLPVLLDVKAQPLPDLALALILEDIEVPGRQNDLAEFATTALRLLEAGDTFGALDCIGPSSRGKAEPYEGQWRVHLQKSTDRPGIISEIRKTKEWGDPPSYMPYLRQAARGLNKTEAKIRHIILAGDGDADFQSGSENISNFVKMLHNDGITISTVAINADKAGTKFLADIARRGGGNAYVTLSANDFGRVLLHDLSAVGQPLIVEQRCRVTSTTNQSAFTGIDWTTAPPLQGFNRAALKSGANLFLVSDRNDPLCAGWKFGAGKALAFLSQNSAPWGAAWLQWPENSKFWKQAARWTFRPAMRQTPPTGQ